MAAADQVTRGDLDMPDDAYVSAVGAELARHEASLDELARSVESIAGISVPETADLREQLDALEQLGRPTSSPLPVYAIVV